MPSASCCFLLVFYIAGNQYQTESKRDKNGRSLFLENMEKLEGKSTRSSARGGHEEGGHACPPWARPYPREPTVRRLMLFFCRKKANIGKKITVKVSGQSELRISIYIRNGETEPEQNAEPEKTERYIQSRRGSRPSHAMEAKDQRGNPSPI